MRVRERQAGDRLPGRARADVDDPPPAALAHRRAAPPRSGPAARGPASHRPPARRRASASSAPPSGGPPVLVTRISTGPSRPRPRPAGSREPLEVAVSATNGRTVARRSPSAARSSRSRRAARDRDPRALARERRRDPAPDALARAQHQRDPAFDPQIHDRSSYPSAGDRVGAMAEGTSTSRSSRRSTQSTAPMPAAARCTRRARGAQGTFTATPARGARSRVPSHLQGEPVTALVRFSNASGDPEAHDADREGRGMAVKLRWDGGETDILATTRPRFVTRTPEDFLELMRLRRPDPETGQPDFEKLGAYLGAHPEAAAGDRSGPRSAPSRSRASRPPRYFSPHAFCARRRRRRAHLGALSLDPDGRRAAAPRRRGAARGRDYLHDELAERLAAGPVAFDLRFQLAGADDPLDDPTAVWPEERERSTAGRLEIDASRPRPRARRITSTSSTRRGSSTGRALGRPDPPRPPRGLLGLRLRRWGRPPGPPPGERRTPPRLRALASLGSRPRRSDPVPPACVGQGESGGPFALPDRLREFQKMKTSAQADSALRRVASDPVSRRRLPGAERRDRRGSGLARRLRRRRRELVVEQQPRRPARTWRRSSARATSGSSTTR